MRVYRYDPVACGVPENGIRCRDADTEIVTDPAVADVFVIPSLPSALSHNLPQQAAQMRAAFPHLADHPERHFCVEFVERLPPPQVPGMCYVRMCGTPECQAAYPTMVPGPWWVGNGMFGADLGDRLDAAAGSYLVTHDAAFVGWRSTYTVAQAVDSIMRAFSERAIVACFDDFHGHRAANDETRRRELLFTDAMQAAWLHLAPASIPGVLRYRVFEALRAGRIPVVIDGPILWPRAEVVEWADIALHLSPNQASDVGPILKDWLRTQTPADLEARGRRARAAWVRAFDGRRADAMFAEMARTHILDVVGRR